MTTVSSRTLPLLVALALGACTHRAPERLTVAESAGEIVAARPVIVSVTSAYDGPLAIYSMNEGVATRLGDVTPGRREQFRIEATALPLSGVMLVGVPQRGDARASSERLRLTPGSVVEFTIGRTLAEASARVRSP